ncbi:MAG: RNA polymerase sigma factor [Candidatus Binatia bacterium]|jgi:RNA polymerase sigma-70 factor, ECF subfamily
MQSKLMAPRNGLLSRNLAALDALNETSTRLNAQADPDVQLMLAVQQGDQAAYHRLFEKHVAGVIGFAMQFVGNRARAEELAQDVFLQVYRTRLRYTPRARFKTWLYRMVTNACLSELRRPEHRVHVQPLDPPSREEIDEAAASSEVRSRSGEEISLDREAVDRLRAAVAELPAQQRAALLLARVNGLSYDEVAASLSCSVSAVKSLIHRATVTLREQMRSDAE